MSFQNDYDYDIYQFSPSNNENNLNLSTNQLLTNFESNEDYTKKILNTTKKKNNLGKKRGKQTNIPRKKKPHDRNSNDNIRRRIKKTFFNYIIIFLNSIFKNYLKDEQFYYISYEEKKKNNSRDIKKHFLSTISQILELDIQKNYFQKNKKHNMILYQNIIKNNKEFDFLMNMKLYVFYEEIYLKSYVYKQYLELLSKQESKSYFEKYNKLSNTLIEFAKIEKEENVILDNINWFFNENPIDYWNNYYLNNFYLNTPLININDCIFSNLDE